MKVMLVGGLNDFTQEIVNRFSADYYSRSNGYNIDDDDIRNTLAVKSLDYNVLILHTYTIHNSQTLLLQDVLRQWMDNDHDGQIIVTGSSSSHFVSYKPNPAHWVYTSQKSSLDMLCKMVSKKCTEGKYKFKISVIKPGMLDSEKSRNKSYFIKGVNNKVFTDTLEYIINLPKDIHIPEIVLETTYV